MSVYARDRKEYLCEAIESVQHEDVDIFIQLDGKVPQEIVRYLDELFEEKKIVYLGKREQNFGLAYSLNQLIEIVLKRGYTYIARMDADDISTKERFARQLAFMEHNRDIDVCGGYILEKGEEFGYEKIVQYPLFHEEMFRFFSKRVPLAHVTAFFRRSFFEKAGLYPTESPTNEDTLMWMKGFKQGCRFANIPEVLVEVRVGPGYFGRRGGIVKAWSDFRDRVKVIRTLGYNFSSYIYAFALFIVNISPAPIKKILYKRLR